jgi:chromosome segregation ATPase
VYHRREQAITDSAQYRNLEACVGDLNTSYRLAEADARSLRVSARETAEQARRVSEQCKGETAKAEIRYENACEEEQRARDHLSECQRAVAKCKCELDSRETNLHTAEWELEEARRALEIAAAQKSESDHPVDLSSYEAAVTRAENQVEVCQLEFDDAVEALSMSEEAAERAALALEAAVEQRIAAARRLAKCKEATSHAGRAEQIAGDAVQLVVLVDQDVDDLRCEVDSAINGCHEMNELASQCGTTTQRMCDQMVKNWGLLSEAGAHVQRVSERGETGMGCCQQAIIDLDARRLALARFEATTVQSRRI